MACPIYGNRLDTGSIEKNPGQGHSRATTDNEDWHLFIIVRDNKDAMTSQLSYDPHLICGQRQSSFKGYCLQKDDRWLFAIRPASCILLTFVGCSSVCPLDI